MKKLHLPSFESSIKDVAFISRHDGFTLSGIVQNRSDVNAKDTSTLTL